MLSELLVANKTVSAAHLTSELVDRGFVPLIAHGGAAIAIKDAAATALQTGPSVPAAGAEASVAEIRWPEKRSGSPLSDEEAVGRWGFKDTQLAVVNPHRAAEVLVKISSSRYALALEP